MNVSAFSTHSREPTAKGREELWVSTPMGAHTEGVRPTGAGARSREHVSEEQVYFGTRGSLE